MNAAVVGNCLTERLATMELTLYHYALHLCKNVILQT